MLIIIKNKLYFMNQMCHVSLKENITHILVGIKEIDLSIQNIMMMHEESVLTG